MPGAWPPVTIGDRRYMDGGVGSTLNLALAGDCDVAVVLVPAGRSAPSPFGGGGAARSTRFVVQAFGVFADDESLTAFGANPLDPACRVPSARAGREQGRRVAGDIAVSTDSLVQCRCRRLLQDVERASGQLMSDLDDLGGAVESELRQALRGASISIRSAADSAWKYPRWSSPCSRTNFRAVERKAMLRLQGKLALLRRNRSRSAASPVHSRAHSDQCHTLAKQRKGS